MKAEIRDAWADALESGDYKQGIGYLTRIDDPDGEPRHCCLGVLCELAVKANVIPEGTESYMGTSLRYGAENDTAFLPLEVQEWADFEGLAGNVQFKYDGSFECADHLNDSIGLTFPEIAKLVREQL